MVSPLKMAAQKVSRAKARLDKGKTTRQRQKAGQITKSQAKPKLQKTMGGLCAMVAPSPPGTPVAVSEGSTSPIAESNKSEEICISPADEMDYSPEVTTPPAPKADGCDLKILKIFDCGKIKSIIDYSDSASGGVKVFDRERDQHHQFIEIYFHGHLVELANLSTCEVVFRTKRSPESLGHLGGRPIAASYCNGDFVATLDLSTHVYGAISTAS